MKSALYDLVMMTLFLVFKVGPYAALGTIPLSLAAVYFGIPTWKKPKGKRHKVGKHRKQPAFGGVMSA